MLEPVYNEKVIKILELFDQKWTREEVAEHFRYASYRSMDEYMRRKNFRWDKRDQTYVAANVKRERVFPKETDFPTEKVRRIVQAFEKGTVDPKELAEQLGFKDHFKMADYMTSKGFQWSNEASNYVRNNHTSLTEHKEKLATTSMGKEAVSAAQPTELLAWLAENKQVIQLLIDEQTRGSSVETIPRFALPGTFITKSVHMTNLLDQMVRDFSQEKNINQREIFEVALIEFFQKYGFKREVESCFEGVN